MRGTGIRFHAGTPTHYGDGGGALFNPDADPFDPAGLMLVKDRNSQEWADRYCGGRREDGLLASPWQSEFMMFIGQGLVMAARGEIELPAGAFLEPGSFDRNPTLKERADAEYMVSAAWVGEVWKRAIPIEPGDGKTAQTAMPVNRPDVPYKFFTEPNARLKSITMYYQNTAPTATGLSPRWPIDTPGGPSGEAEARLALAKAEAEAIRKLLPAKGGKPMQLLVQALLPRLEKIAALCIPLLLALALAGCGSSGVFRTLFTGVSSADAEFSGVKSGPAISAAGAINPEAGQLSSLLTALGQGDPLSQYLGVIMPVLLLNETQPRWIICSDKLIVKCQGIPLNAKVQFSGKPIGPGLLWRPTRLTAEGYDD
jgi:hypothetical protein